MQLPPDTVGKNVQIALKEDLGQGNIHACLVDPHVEARATLISRSEGVFCGRPWVDETMRQVDPAASIEWLVQDGSNLRKNQELMRVRGKANSLLTAERTMLNFAQLLSGTATTTARFVSLTANTQAKILDTRKTIPGLRAAQKYAVRIGGGHNHRIGLFDAFLIKENHISAAGSIARAVEQARSFDSSIFLEVEVESFPELREAIQCKVDRILLDNFTVEALGRAVKEVAHTIETEASGGIDETNVLEIAKTGVDYISIGLLTKRVNPLDFTLMFEQRRP